MALKIGDVVKVTIESSGYLSTGSIGKIINCQFNNFYVNFSYIQLRLGKLGVDQRSFVEKYGPIFYVKKSSVKKLSGYNTTLGKILYYKCNIMENEDGSFKIVI